MIFLVFLLIAYSSVSSLPQTMMAFSGIGKAKIILRGSAISFEGGLVLRVMREIILMGIVFYGVGHFLISSKYKKISNSTVTFFWGIVCWVVLVAWVAYMFYDLPPMVILLGIRTFQYVILAFIGYFLAKNSPKAVLIRFADLLRWYTFLLVALGMMQVLFQIGPANVTLFGIRAFGPFPNYNLFGTTLASCGLTFLLADFAHNDLFNCSKYRLWFIVCLLMTLASGSRGATLISLGCASYLLYIHCNVYLKGIFITILPILAITIFVLLSNQALSGRPIQMTNNDKVFEKIPRIEKWQATVSNADEVHKVFFGWGLGLTTTAISTVYGKDIYEGQADSHSAYLSVFGNFGFVGLCIFLVVILKCYAVMPRIYGLLFFAFVGLIMVPYNIWEFFPVNVLLMFLWGCLTGIGTFEKKHSPMNLCIS